VEGTFSFRFAWVARETVSRAAMADAIVQNPFMILFFRFVVTILVVDGLFCWTSGLSITRRDSRWKGRPPFEVLFKQLFVDLF